MLMPDTDVGSTSDTEVDAAVEAQLDADAEADYAAGRVTSHERMCEWLTKLAKGERAPPPEVWSVRIVWTRTAALGIQRAYD